MTAIKVIVLACLCVCISAAGTFSSEINRFKRDCQPVMADVLEYRNCVLMVQQWSKKHFDLKDKQYVVKNQYNVKLLKALRERLEPQFVACKIVYKNEEEMLQEFNLVLEEQRSDHMISEKELESAVTYLKDL